MSDKTKTEVNRPITKVFVYVGERGVKEVIFSELLDELEGYHFAVCPIPMEIDNVKETRKTVMKSASAIFDWATKGWEKQIQIDTAQANVDAALALLTEAVTSGLVDLIMNATDTLQGARKNLQKAERGSTRSGNGSRSNPLPPIATTNAVIRGQNGGTVLAIRGKAIPDGAERGLTDQWEMFKKSDGGFWEYFIPLGHHDAWSGLNQEISARLGLTGKSIGTNGLQEVSETNLETIRTTQLRNLPEVAKVTKKAAKK